MKLPSSDGRGARSPAEDDARRPLPSFTSTPLVLLEDGRFEPWTRGAEMVNCAAVPGESGVFTLDRVQGILGSRFSYDGGMARYLHTMYRITDPAKSEGFYEALGMELRRELPIVRDGDLEATNYFFGFPGQEEELELTFNHDGRTYEPGTAYGHIAIGVNDLDETLERLKERGIEPERPPYTVREGGSRICFVRDPDSYRVELIERH